MKYQTKLDVHVHVDCHMISSRGHFQSGDEIQSGLILDVVVTEGTSVLELLPGEDEPLLVRWDSLLVLKQVLSNLILQRFKMRTR